MAFTKISKRIVGVILIIICFSLENVQAQDWADLNRFKKVNSEIAPPLSTNNRVVFMGNSITIGWSHKMPEFFKNKSYINRGISGQTTPQMLIRFRADVVNLRPAVVVILAGTNDISGNMGPSTIKMIADNIFSMAEIAKSNNIKVILSSVLPVYDYPWKKGLKPAQKIISLNKLLQDYATRNGHIYLDYFKSMTNDQNGLLDKYTYDGVHPNVEGYKVMGPLVEEAISNALSN